MPHHEERPASTLAHGPAKPDDIERVRRDVGGVRAPERTEPEVERALGEVQAACQAIREDLGDLKRTIESERAPAAERQPARS